MQAGKGLKAVIHRRGRLTGCCAALALVLSALVFAPSANALGKEPFYIAIGDSISFGFTEELFKENLPSGDPPSVFDGGFVNQFGKKLGKSTNIVNLACPGETSNGVIGENVALGGGTSTENKKRLKDWHPCAYHNENGLPLHYSLGTKPTSQLEEALAILHEGAPAHPVKAITINIGNNDELAQVAQCKEEFPTEVTSCLLANLKPLFEHIAKNLGDIIGAIDSMAVGGGHYTGRIILLGGYNPNAFVLPMSDPLQEKFNEVLQKEVVPAFPNVRFANPFPVFNKDAGTKPTKEQAAICKYTEMCNPNVQTEGGSPPGKDGDIHPSPSGYKALAKLVGAAFSAP
jgi:lysophospholipase L1-like esterase